jgi:DNA mismatch repair protein MutS
MPDPAQTQVDQPAARSRKSPRLSPGRRQYLELKRTYPDALLLFRMGDFYETFDDDARTTARVLDIALTARDVGNGAKAPLAGIPARALDSYLARLIQAGFKVEQTSDPASSKGIVDRAVVRVVTPGTVTEPGLLDQARNNYLAAAVAGDNAAGLAWIDISTSEFVTAQVPLEALADEVNRLQPAEILVNESARSALEGARLTPSLRSLDAGRLDPDVAELALLAHFRAETLEAFGCAGKPFAVMAAAAVIGYLRETQLGAMPHVTSLRTDSPDGFMRLDHRALRDLEVTEPLAGGSASSTLLSVVGRTRTAMGGRLLRSWLTRPLLDLRQLLQRQSAVSALVDDPVRRGQVRDILRRVPDIERLLNRARTFAATPRDVAALGAGLQAVPHIIEAIPQAQTAPRGAPGDGLAAEVAGLLPCGDAAALIAAAIADDPPLAAGDGSAVRPGFDPALDEARALSGDAHSLIASIESTAREQTGIRSLKVSYNRVFGYFIEVSKPNLARVPAEWERRQTLVNGERYVTAALKDYESKVLTARDRISELERSAFRRVCGEVAAHGERIMASARAIAVLDALTSFAEVAAVYGWTRPELTDEPVIEIRGGRHPAVEAALGPGRFVPNDTTLSAAGPQILLVTGPNMAGKSTYIRQVAVLTLMAQAGSYVPADHARIGLADRIFTRAGLSDDISGGRSTFMTEMVETASVLNQATPRSLAVLDEIGRGTSTYDGLAIARAVVEHIHNNPRTACRTLFATHYHEITALPGTLPRVANLRVAVAEENGVVTFLHRIVPGAADRSYGVHVARIAGMPAPVVARAWEVLAELERGGGHASASPGGSTRAHSPARKPAAPQLALFTDVDPVIDELRSIDLNALSPIDALNTLFRLQRKSLDGNPGAR